MKRLFVTISMALAIALGSCGVADNQVNTTISGRVVGLNADSLYLERVSDKFAQPERLGAVCLADNGAFSFELNIPEDESPRFYRLVASNDVRPVTLVVSPGDEITIESAGDMFLNYEVEGSEESQLIKQFNQEYFTACDRLALIAERLNLRSAYTEQEAYNAAKEAVTAQLRFVGTNQGRLAALYALRHKVAEQYIPQLEGFGITIVHYRAVLEALRKSYPESPYIAILEQYIAEEEMLVDLANRVELASHPEIELEDIYKHKHKLSDLDGKVVLLYFWISQSALCNTINADLKSLYERYHDKGFEVYHVSADSDIAVWIEAVRQQEHPWISVYGGATPSVFTLFNVEQLPKAYIIERDGDISHAPLGIQELEREIKRRL